MKKIMLLSVLALMLFAGAASAAPDIQISVLNMSQEIQPGGSFTVKVQVANNGDGKAEDIEIYPEVRNPFRIKAGTSPKETVSQMILGEQASGTFHLTVLPRTSSGVYDLKLVATFTYNNKLYKVTKNIAINVEAKPILEVLSTEYPGAFPGDFIDIRLGVKNIGGGLAKNVRVIYENTSSEIRPSSVAVAYLDEILAGSEADIDLNLVIDGEAEAMTYPVKITMLYENEGGTQQPAVIRTIGLVVRSKIELKAFPEGGTIVQGVPSSLTVSIANTGPSTANYLEVVPVQDSFIVTPRRMYIGDLESDDFDTIDLEITAQEAGEHKLSLEFIYKDANNAENRELGEVSFKALTPREAAALQPRSKTPYVLLLIILGGGIWYWRRRKKKQKHGRAS